MSRLGRHMKRSGATGEDARRRALLDRTTRRVRRAIPPDWQAATVRIDTKTQTLLVDLVPPDGRYFHRVRARTIPELIGASRRFVDAYDLQPPA